VKFPSNGIMPTPALPPNHLKPLGDPDPKQAVVPSATVRSSTSKRNKFTIKARLIRISYGEVTPEKEDSEILTVALEQPSEPDQKLAHELADESEQNPVCSKCETM
jgi:hypothetical protein